MENITKPVSNFFKTIFQRKNQYYIFAIVSVLYILSLFLYFREILIYGNDIDYEQLTSEINLSLKIMTFFLVIFTIALVIYTSLQLTYIFKQDGGYESLMDTINLTDDTLNNVNDTITKFSTVQYQKLEKNKDILMNYVDQVMDDKRILMKDKQKLMGYLDFWSRPIYNRSKPLMNKISNLFSTNKTTQQKNE